MASNPSYRDVGVARDMSQATAVSRMLGLGTGHVG